MPYMGAMDRRRFMTMMAGGVGLAAFGRGDAQVPMFSPDVLPPPPPRPGAPVLSGTRQLILARARDALERHHDVIALRDRVALADFTVASRDLRFHIVDLIGGQLNSYLVAHGKGSDPDHSGWLQRFSNEPNSLATSDGAYLTGQIYEGVHGQAMRLIGLDADNSNAEPRAIVIHGADYVGEDHVAKWGKLGRSEGCFAVAPHMLPQVLGMLGPGRMLFADKI